MVLIVREEVLGLVGNSFDIAPVTLVVVLVSKDDGAVLGTCQGSGRVVNEVILFVSGIGARIFVVCVRC